MNSDRTATCPRAGRELPVPSAATAISLETFRKAIPDCDVYIRHSFSGALKLYRKKSQKIEPADLDRLAKRGVSVLYLSVEDQEEYRRRKATEICQDSTLPPTERYNLLREISRASFEAAHHSGNVKQVVAFVVELGQQLADVLCDSDLVLSELFALMDHDNGTYSHSVNVATYTMLLAKYLGVGEGDYLCTVATGGLLHDLGKRYIDPKILNKPDKLSSADRRRLEQHPTFGFRDLLPRGDLPWELLMMVYQHHERYDGHGYPVGLPGSEIHELARATTVADVFHAITSERSYRQPMSTREACDFLADQAGKMFDPEMVKCWTYKMKKGERV